MDGKTLTEMFLDAVDKPDVDLLQLNARTVYRNLDAAAIEFSRMTRHLVGEFEITTVLSQQRYDLPPDFLDMHVFDYSRRLVVKYVDADGDDHWPVVSSYEKIFRANETDSKDYPARVAIGPRLSDESQITGAITLTAAASGGEASLNDSAATFEGTVQARDNVHNTTRQSHGIVLSVVSDTQLKCAMFGGTSSGFAGEDSYVIIPAATQQLVLDAPSAVADETITVPYIRMPNPVFSDYGTWGLPEQSCRAICKEAAFQFLSGKKLGKPVALHHKSFLDEIKRVREEAAMRALQGGNYLARL